MKCYCRRQGIIFMCVIVTVFSFMKYNDLVTSVLACKTCMACLKQNMHFNG